MHSVNWTRHTHTHIRSLFVVLGIFQGSAHGLGLCDCASEENVSEVIFSGAASRDGSDWIDVDVARHLHLTASAC